MTPCLLCVDTVPGLRALYPENSQESPWQSIVLVSQMDNVSSAPLFHRAGPVLRATNARQFDVVLTDRDYYLFDAGVGRNAVIQEPSQLPVRTLVCSSPDESHYRHRDRTARLYMPVWSMQEVTAASPYLVPPTTVRATTGASSTPVSQLKIALQRYFLYGGIARWIFSESSDNEVERDVFEAMTKANLIRCAEYLAFVGDYVDVSYRLIHYIVAASFEDKTQAWVQIISLKGPSRCCTRQLSKRESPSCETLSTVPLYPCWLVHTSRIWGTG